MQQNTFSFWWTNACTYTEGKLQNNRIGTQDKQAENITQCMYSNIPTMVCTKVQRQVGVTRLQPSLVSVLVQYVPTAQINKLYIDNTAKWKTRILRQMQTADPDCMGRKSCQYNYISGQTGIKLYWCDVLPILTGSAVYLHLPFCALFYIKLIIL